MSVARIMRSPFAIPQWKNVLKTTKNGKEMQNIKDALCQKQLQPTKVALFFILQSTINIPHFIEHDTPSVISAGATRPSIFPTEAVRFCFLRYLKNKTHMRVRKF